MSGSRGKQPLEQEKIQGLWPSCRPLPVELAPRRLLLPFITSLLGQLTVLFPPACSPWAAVAPCPTPTCCLVAQSCPTLCEPMDCGRPGLPVLHSLPEFAQIRVH